jgi:6-phosphogluconolactonase (cycloisomerase 2 family)
MVYTADDASGGVSTFAPTPAGPLAPFGENDVAGHPNGFGGLVVTPDGRHLYLGDLLPGKTVSAGTVTAFAVGAGGLLTQQSQPLTLPEIPFSSSITPSGSYLIVNLGSTLASYAIGPSGVLTPTGPPVARPFTYGPGMAITPDGQTLFVANSVSGTISRYLVAPNGTLAHVGADVATGTGSNSRPWALAIAPDGHELFAANRDLGIVSTFSIGAGGALTQTSTGVISGLDAHSGVFALAVSLNGRYLYSANSGQGSATAFAIGSGGALTPLGTVFTDQRHHAYPDGIGVSSDGHHVYVANGLYSTVATLAVGSDGRLTWLGSNAQSGGSPEELVVDRSSSAGVTKTATFGDQRVSATSVPGSPCVASTRTLPVALAAVTTAHGSRERFVKATLSWTPSSKRQPRPTRVVHVLPDAEQLSLAKLRAGTHTLTLVITYRKPGRKRVAVTRTIRLRVSVC